MAPFPNLLAALADVPDLRQWITDSRLALNRHSDALAHCAAVDERRRRGGG